MNLYGLQYSIAFTDDLKKICAMNLYGVIEEYFNARIKFEKSSELSL